MANMSFYDNGVGLPVFDEGWEVSHQDMSCYYENVVRGVHHYWRFLFEVNASTMYEAANRVLSYAHAKLSAQEDLRGSFAEAIVGAGLSFEPKNLRYKVYLYIVDTGSGCLCDPCRGISS